MLTFNGKKFKANDFAKSLEDGVVEITKAELGERFRSICHPKTKEFPTVIVLGKSISEISLKVEGSKELLEHIKLKIPESETNQVNFVERRKIVPPKVFLSFGWEDHQLAEKIANKLMVNGIDTWWAEWEIQSGDSIRQRIDEGLGICTHFVVLLSKESIEKPWVKQEMDAGLVRMLDEKCKFIPLRYELRHNQLPPLLSGRYSPEIKDDDDFSQLINDIHGISNKPSLGKAPFNEELPDIGFSIAATALAKLFCDKSETGTSSDPMLSIEQVVELTSLSKDDIEDALYELRSFIKDDHYHIRPESELFVEFDKAFRGWTPEEDALRIASSILNDENFPSNVQQISERYDWEPRRINSAINYLTNREICRDTEVTGTHPWAQPYLQEKQSGAIRRFVKSRS